MGIGSKSHSTDVFRKSLSKIFEGRGGKRISYYPRSMIVMANLLEFLMIQTAHLWFATSGLDESDFILEFGYLYT